MDSIGTLISNRLDKEVILDFTKIRGFDALLVPG
jgi:hypothetical protein